MSHTRIMAVSTALDTLSKCTAVITATARSFGRPTGAQQSDPLGKCQVSNICSCHGRVITQSKQSSTAVLRASALQISSRSSTEQRTRTRLWQSLARVILDGWLRRWAATTTALQNSSSSTAADGASDGPCKTRTEPLIPLTESPQESDKIFSAFQQRTQLQHSLLGSSAVLEPRSSCCFYCWPPTPSPPVCVLLCVAWHART
jgi:hypothetical protein